jgi:branched-chain amino acid transport system substrate-binding protein
MNNKKHTLLVLTLCLSTCLSTGISQAAKITLEIGVLAPKNAWEKSALDEILRAAQMSVDNAKVEFDKLGFQIKVRHYSDNLPGDNAEQISDSILNKDKSVMALVGSLKSSINLNLAQSLKKEMGVVLPTNSADPLTRMGLPNVVRLVSTDDSLVKTITDYMVDGLGVKKIVVVDFQNLDGRNFMQSLSKYAGQKKLTIAKSISVAPLSDYAASVHDLKTLQPEVVFIYPDRYEYAVKMVKEIQATNINTTIIGNSTFADPDFAKALGSKAQGLLYISTLAPIAGYPNAKNFTAEYDKRYKYKPTGMGLINFDATEVILKAIRMSIADNNGKAPSRGQVMANLRKVKDKNMLSGSISFNAQGDRIKSTAFIMEMDAGGTSRVKLGIPITLK